MARIGATAFAVGLLLAGPQAAGVATADRGDAGNSASASDDTRGSTSDDAASDDEPGRALRPGAASDPATEDEPDVEVSINERDVDISIGEPLPEISIDEPQIKIHIDPYGPEAPVGEALPLLPEEPAVPPVEDTGESIPADTESTAEESASEESESEESPADESPADESVSEPPAEESTEDVDSPDGDEQLILDDPVAVEDGVPGRGGADPLPWWRTTTAGEDGADTLDGPKPEELCGECDVRDVVWMYDGPRDDDLVALPVAVPGSGEEQETAVPLVGAGSGPAEQFIATLKVKVVEALDVALNWLSGLPTTQFTEFLSGVLLLVRRTLVPEVCQGTGCASTSEPGDFDELRADNELAGALIGLTEAAAVDEAESGGWVTRVVARDGEYYAVTTDYIAERVNLTVIGGIVMSVSVG
jgi:hypothetical protein